jgi:hypothetical protein
MGIHRQDRSDEQVKIEAYDSKSGLLDLNPDEGEPVEIRVSEHAKVVWVNVGPRCVLRVNQITGEVVVHDERRGR